MNKSVVPLLPVAVLLAACATYQSLPPTETLVPTSTQWVSPSPTRTPTPAPTPTLISPTQALTSWPVYTLQDVGLTVRYPPDWVVRESPNHSLQSLVMRSVGFVPPRYAKSDAPQVPTIGLAVYRPPLTNTLRAWLDAHSTTEPFGSPAGPEVHFFGVNDIVEVEASGFLALRFTHDVFGFTVHELLLAMEKTVISLGYDDLGVEDLEPTFLQMQESLAPTTPTQPPESKFPRAEAWFAVCGNEFPTDEQMQQLVEAFSADVVTYLQKAITTTAPLEDQASALARMAADLPGFEGGQVVPVNLDDVAEAELFIVPMLNGGPLLYARHTPAGWQTVPVPVAPPGEKEAVAAAPNLWPHSAEARDVNGDGHPEAVTIHTFSGASNTREHPQVLCWDGEVFTVLFRTELVSWAGPSQWHFEPHGNGQDIVLHYPYFYNTGFEAKMIAHPWGHTALAMGSIPGTIRASRNLVRSGERSG